uniref:Iminophenyl-pyruvate dimer synthase domain-containing protein n=1 Tax=Ciona savignyi TaxID=51511 RepID=H2Y809_CIOSA
AKIAELHKLGEAAIITELTTVAPYVTAWLSLKTEYGRNLEVAKIIKSVFVEEMLHMSLAANFINSVGGTVNLTSMALLPQYPTPLGSGTFFDLMPAFYLRVLLFTSMLESCTQMNALNGSNASPTIFTGNVEWQVNMDAWHNPEDQTDSNNDSLEGSASIPISLLYTPLFPIVNLQNAVEAVIEIVYQGEGGSQCTPFVTDPTKENPNPEKSHYYRFLEIAHQKEIVKMNVPNGWNAGAAIPLNEDGVWPLVKNPQNGMYKENTKAWKLNLEFNRIYTTLLKCLQVSFGGNPSLIQGCYSYMYQLTGGGQ